MRRVDYNTHTVVCQGGVQFFRPDCREANGVEPCLGGFSVRFQALALPVAPLLLIFAVFLWVG